MKEKGSQQQRQKSEGSYIQQIICLKQTLRTSENSPDINNDVDGVGQQFEGELCLQEGVNLLYVVRDVFTDVLKKGKNGFNVRKNRVTAEGKTSRKSRSGRGRMFPVLNVSHFHERPDVKT